MTDARIPERYLVDRRVVRLTDSQRSSYFMSTLWSVSNRTDGYVDQDDLPFIPTFNVNTVDALVSCGLWKVTGSGWTDVEFANVQTLKSDLEVLDNARRADREKKRRQREAKRDSSPSSPSIPGSVPGTFPGDSTGEERTGKARTGKGQPEFSEPDVNTETGEVTDWYTAPVPQPAVAEPIDSDCICSIHQTPWPCEHNTPDCEWSYPA